MAKGYGAAKSGATINSAVKKIFKIDSKCVLCRLRGQNRSVTSRDLCPSNSRDVVCVSWIQKGAPSLVFEHPNLGEAQTENIDNSDIIVFRAFSAWRLIHGEDFADQTILIFPPGILRCNIGVVTQTAIKFNSTISPTAELCRYLIERLRIGVENNRKTCIAEQIDVVGRCVDAIIQSQSSQPLAGDRGPEGQAKATLRTHREEEIHRVKRVIRENIQDPNLSPRDIAKRACMSERKLYYLAKMIGMTPAVIIRQERLEYCKAIIEKGDATLNLSELSRAAGFKSYSHFSNLFRKEFSISPRLYLKG